MYLHIYYLSINIPYNNYIELQNFYFLQFYFLLLYSKYKYNHTTYIDKNISNGIFIKNINGSAFKTFDLHGLFAYKL